MHQKLINGSSNHLESDANISSTQNLGISTNIGNNSQPWWGNGIGHHQTISKALFGGTTTITMMTLSPPNTTLNGDLPNQTTNSSSQANQVTGSGSKNEADHKDLLQSDGKYGEEQQVSSATPPPVNEYLVPHTQLELSSHSIGCGSYAYSEPYFGGVMPFGAHALRNFLSFSHQTLISFNLLSLFSLRPPLPRRSPPQLLRTTFSITMSSSSSDSDSGSDFQGTWTVREDFIEKAVKAELKKFKVQRLTITFDKTTPQYVRIHKKMFYYTLYVSVGITISPSILLWKDVPQTDITSILDRLETKFIYPRDNPIVMDEIEALMRKALHDRRNEMKVWWMKNVVELGLEKANRKPYMGVMMGDWIPLTHFFNSNQPQKNEMASHKRAFQLVSTAESGASCKGGDEAIGEKRAIDLSGQKDLVKDLKGSRESYQDLRERSKAMYSFTLTMYQHMQQLTKFVPGFKFELPPPPPPLPDSPDYTTKRKKLHSPDSSDSSSDEDDEDPSVNDI